VRNYVSCSFLCEFFSLRIEGIHIFAGWAGPMCAKWRTLKAAKMHIILIKYIKYIRMIPQIFFLWLFSKVYS
jgi:hypothetical protein